jgi:hypothetical protein
MAALTKDRNTPVRQNVLFSYGVAAATTIFAGSLICINAAGFAVPGSVSATLKAVGRAEETVDNSSGSDADVNVPARKGTFKFANAGDITLAHLETDVYINDDQTVSSVSTSKSVAGKCVDIESDGVWVEFK